MNPYLPLIFLAACLVTLLIGYAVLIGTLLYHWRRLLSSLPPPEAASLPVVSILVVSRDEGKRLLNCLRSLLCQEYARDRYEILLVDDHSSDGSIAIAQKEFGNSVHWLSLQAHLGGRSINSYKKAGLALAAKKARGELLLTTDADCVVPSTWVATHAAFYCANALDAWGAPVRYLPGDSPLERFQAIEQAGMQVLTAVGMASGRLLLANGANLACTRKAFERVQGYTGIDSFASGDDLLLVQKVAAAGGKIGFLPAVDSMVNTYPQTKWKDLWQQRSRWASKWQQYRRSGVSFVQVWVFLFHAGLFLTIALLPLIALFLREAFIPWATLVLSVFLLKLLIDRLLLRAGCEFFSQLGLLRDLWRASLFQLLIFTLTGLHGIRGGTYVWKGRKVR